MGDHDSAYAVMSHRHNNNMNFVYPRFRIAMFHLMERHQVEFDDFLKFVQEYAFPWFSILSDLARNAECSIWSTVECAVFRALTLAIRSRGINERSIFKKMAGISKDSKPNEVDYFFYIFVCLCPKIEAWKFICMLSHCKRSAF